MFRASTTVGHETGLHARPAAELVSLAASFAADITVAVMGRTVDAKSIIQVLSLGAGKGAEVVIEASGRDAEEAVRALARFVASPSGTARGSGEPGKAGLTGDGARRDPGGACRSREVARP